MTHRSPVRLLAGAAFLVLLSSCAGSGTGVDPAAAAAAASAPTTDRSSGNSAAGTTTDGVPGDGTDGGSQGHPGGPGGDPGDGGGGGGGGVAAGKPGAPGDETVFEERGVSYAEFRDGSAKTACVEEGKCTLAPPQQQKDETSYPDLEQCPIANMTYSGGTHPNAEGREAFFRGATVTVTVSCLRFTDPDANGIPGDQSAPDGSTPDSGTSQQSTTNGTTTDGTTTDGTTTDGTTTDGTAPANGEQPQG